jgi:hypothetical protein
VLIIINPWIFSEWITVNMCVSCYSICISCRNWQSSLQGLDSVAIAAIPRRIRSSVVSVDAWDLWNISFMDVVVLSNISFMDAVNDSIMCIIFLNCLPVTKALSSFFRSCYGGCFLGGMISGIEKHSNRWLALATRNQRLVVSHTLSSVLPRSYEYSTYAIGGNR